MQTGMVVMNVVTSLTPKRAKPRTIASPTRKAGIAVSTRTFSINPASTQIESGSHSMQLAVSGLHGCVLPLFNGRLFNGSESRRAAPHLKYRLERSGCISRLKCTACHVNAANSAMPQMHKTNLQVFPISELDTKSGGTGGFQVPIVANKSISVKIPLQRNWRCPAAHRRNLYKTVFFCRETTDFDCHQVERTSYRAGVHPPKSAFRAHCYALVRLGSSL